MCVLQLHTPHVDMDGCLFWSAGVLDFRYFASIGVDWLKEDSCYDSGDSAVAIQHYATLRDALNATGRKIWYALCGWEPFYASDPSAGNLLANSARIGMRLKSLL